MSTRHNYDVHVVWSGNLGEGNARLSGYSRDHEIRIEGKQTIAASSDPAFRGDPARHNPEELLVAALSECHMLWYLSLTAKAGVVVTAYEDHAFGTMVEHADGSGEFVIVTLRPLITLADPSQRDAADAVHEQAHHKCFIARSVNFPVTVEANYV